MSLGKLYVYQNGKWRLIANSSSAYTLNSQPPDENNNFQITLEDLHGINADKIELVDNTNTEGTAIGVKNEITKSGSIAIGTENKTTGTNSSTLGYKNNAIGNNSFAVGRNNYAFNDGAVTIGFSNSISSEDSIALGGMNKASGDRNSLLGFSNTVTQGDNTFTFGNRNLTKEDETISIGFSNKHYANNSISIGLENTLFGIRSIAIGQGNSIGLGSGDSIAIGNYTKTNAKHAVAIGYYSEANGEVSRSLGHRTITEGDYSVSFGKSNESKGDYALTHGLSNEARELHSLALGEKNISGFEHAVTLGDNNFNLAKHSVVIGQGLKNNINYAHVIGHYNELDDASPSTEPTKDNNVWAVGNGMSDTERNTVARIQHDGQMFIDGRYRSKGADYAEYFEWLDGNKNNEDRVGLFVTLVGDKIKLADSEDDIIGIVSAAPSVVGNDPDKWHNKFITDAFGRVQFDEEGKHIINPMYNHEEKYISREQRKEWDMIGLLGQMYLVDDGTCKVGDYATASKKRVATKGNKDNGYKVMKRISKNIDGKSGIVKVLFK